MSLLRLSLSSDIIFDILFNANAAYGSLEALANGYTAQEYLNRALSIEAQVITGKVL